MIKVLIADDHHLVREGISLLLGGEQDISIIGQAADGAEAVRMIAELKPDIVILDISMPKMNGIEAAQRVLSDGYKGKIIILTQFDKEEYVRKAIQIGARGYLLKDSLKSEVIDAIRKIFAGEIYVSSSISRLLVDEYVQQLKRKRISRDIPELTPREVEVLRLIAGGLSTKQIADKLYLSVRTIDFHRANISQKLGIHDIAGLTLYAVRHGLVKV
jgi:two-component system, NarL family, response regulator NreC